MKRTVMNTLTIMIAFTLVMVFSNGFSDATFFAFGQFSDKKVVGIDTYSDKTVFIRDFNESESMVLTKEELDQYVYDTQPFESHGKTYTFKGWYDEDGNDLFKDDDFVTLTDQCTIYAKYKIRKENS